MNKVSFNGNYKYIDNGIEMEVILVRNPEED